jgi:hypothetical protein
MVGALTRRPGRPGGPGPTWGAWADLEGLGHRDLPVASGLLPVRRHVICYARGKRFIGNG